MVPYGEKCYSYRIDSSFYLPSTDKYNLYCHYSLQIEWVPGFIKEGMSNFPYSTRWYHFLHSFYYSVMDAPVLLFVGSIKAWSKNFLKKVNIVHMKYVSIMIAEVKIYDARMN